MTEPTTTETAQPTMADRVKEHGLTLTVVEGPTREVDPARHNSRPWVHYAFRVEITAANGRSFVTSWKQGEAHGGKTPDVADVLDALASDASCHEEARDVLDFAANLGLSLEEDEDRDDVRASYEACGETFRELGELLGEDGRAALMYETERQ